MKSILRVLLGLILGLAATGARASGIFEGEVDMKMTHGSSEGKVVQYFVKGHKTRFQGEDKDGKSPGAAIFDYKNNQFIMIMDKSKMYMVSELHPEKFTYGKDHHFKMTKTGNSQEILGYTCQEYDYTSDENNGKIWFASGIGDWWGAQMAAQSDKLTSDQKAMVSMVLSKKLFPMKSESTDKSGNVKGGMEVVKIEKKSLDSGLFEVPAGYKKFDMGNMFGGNAGGSANQSNSSSTPKKDPLSGVKLPF
jgi:hypothetical protein